MWVSCLLTTREKSWTERIKQRVDTVLKSATSYADFEKQLEERGISCEQKQFTDRKTGKTQDYLLFSYWDEEKCKERKIKNTTLGSVASATSGCSPASHRTRQQVLRQPAIAPEPIKRVESACFRSDSSKTPPTRSRKLLNEQKQAIFNDTREKSGKRFGRRKWNGLSEKRNLSRSWWIGRRKSRQSRKSTTNGAWLCFGEGWNADIVVANQI